MRLHKVEKKIFKITKISEQFPKENSTTDNNSVDNKIQQFQIHRHNRCKSINNLFTISKVKWFLLRGFPIT